MRLRKSLEVLRRRMAVESIDFSSVVAVGMLAAGRACCKRLH